MLWRLFATVLTMTDVGSASVSQIATDWPDQFTCERGIEQLYRLRTDHIIMLNHNIQVRVEAKCIPILPRGEPPIGMLR